MLANIEIDFICRIEILVTETIYCIEKEVFQLEICLII